MWTTILFQRYRITFSCVREDLVPFLRKFKSLNKLSVISVGKHYQVTGNKESSGANMHMKPKSQDHVSAALMNCLGVESFRTVGHSTCVPG